MKTSIYYIDTYLVYTISSIHDIWESISLQF